MSQSEASQQFADQLLALQKGLYAYILTLLPWRDEASDVLQQTNLVLWRDAERFEPGTDFRAWAYRVAYYQVLDCRSRVRRDRLQFDNELMKSLAEGIVADAVSADEEIVLLRECLKKLPEKERDLIGRRYDVGATVKAMAAELDQSPGAVAVRLHRIRQILLDCIRQGEARLDEGANG